MYVDADYNGLKKEFWFGELRKITKLPSSLKNDPEKLKMIRRMTAQFLPCFNYFVGNSYLLPRQGGLQRLICPAEDDKALREDFFPQSFHGRFIWSGAVEEKEDILKIYRYMVRHGIAKGGLYGHMPYRNGNQHIWYLSFPDYYWFKIWKNLGNQEKAREILDFQLRYGMTEEYYMVERYADNDPSYVPRSPNASVNGRTILMLLEI